VIHPRKQRLVVRDGRKKWLLRKRYGLADVLIRSLEWSGTLQQLRWCYEFEIGLKWVLGLRQDCSRLHYNFGCFLDVSFFVVNLLDPSSNLLDQGFVNVALPLRVEVVILGILLLKLSFPLLELQLIQPNLRFQKTKVVWGKDFLHFLLLERVFVEIWKVTFANFFVFDLCSGLFYHHGSVNEGGILWRCGCIRKLLEWWASYKRLTPIFNLGHLFWHFLAWAWYCRYSLGSWLHHVKCLSVTILLIVVFFFADDIVTITASYNIIVIIFIACRIIFRLSIWTTVVFNSFTNFGDEEAFLVSLLTELLAGFFVFFTVDLHFNMANDDPLHFWGGVTVLLAKTGFLGTISPDMFCEFCLSVSDVKFVRMGSSMHHKLLVLVVVRFCHQVGHHMRVLRQ